MVGQGVTEQQQEPQVMMLRANVTPEQVKALRLLAIAADKTMQQLLGELIAEHLSSEEVVA
jgi:hypothetical protein